MQLYSFLSSNDYVRRAMSRFVCYWHGQKRTALFYMLLYLRGCRDHTYSFLMIFVINLVFATT